MPRLILLPMIALLVLGGCGRAPGLSPHELDPAFHALDRDGDGALSRAEASMPEWEFTRLDRDVDGRLSEVEFLAPAPLLPERPLEPGRPTSPTGMPGA